MNAPQPVDLDKLFNKIRQLEIHTPQGLSGLLTKKNRYVFNYNPVKDEAAVSLVMPVREESYASGRAFKFEVKLISGGITLPDE